MANENVGGGCCTQIKGLTKLTFPDGGQVAIVGLEEILAAVYAEGRQVTIETAQEILKRVEAQNYVAPGDRKEYPDLLLKEYRTYVARQQRNSMEGR
jgi:hypothetical protein